MNRTGPSRRAKILTAVLAPIVVLGAAEIVLRIAGFRFDPAAEFVREGTYDELAEKTLYEPDPELLWRLRPSTRLDHGPAGFKGVVTNAAGLRGPELPGAREPGELRVLCLGDSITFGLGLRDGETWPEQTGRALRRARPGRKIRVINAGVPGWSSVQGMRALARLESLKPDVVVFWFGINDAKPMRDFPDSAQRMPGAGRQKTLSTLRRSRVFQLVQGAVTGARRTTVAGERVSLDEFADHIETLRNREREGGPRVIFVRSPERIETTAGQLDRIVARAREEGVEKVAGPARLFNPVVPALRATDLEGTRLDAPDGSALVFQPDRANAIRDVADIAADLARLRAWKAALDDRMALLPESSLDGHALLGDVDPQMAYSDNCHLSDVGCRRAGEAIAKVILEVIDD